MPSIIATPLSRKTLIQKTNQKIKAKAALEFAEKAGKPEFEAVEGGFIEYQDIVGVKAAYFNKYAFIQADDNFNTAGTGLQIANRQEIDTTWLQSFTFVMPDANTDSNIDFFLTNYRKQMYKDKLLDEHFITEGFESLNNSLDILYANRFIFGVDRLSSAPNATQATTHYSGLKDLITKAVADTAVTNINTIDLMSATPTRNIDLSANTSALDTFSQLNNLANKMGNINSVFAYGNASDGSVVWINKGETDIKYVCWNSLIEQIKAKNYQFYKELENLYNTGKLVKLCESSLNVEAINRSSTVTGQATPFSITPTSLGLPVDSILMYDANSFVGFKYELGENSDEITQNNITLTQRKIALCNVTDYLPTGAVAVVKVTALTDLTDSTNP